MADVMTDPSTEPVAANESLVPLGPKPIDPKKVVDAFRTKIEASKRYKRTLTPHWKRNIAIRLGEPGTVSGSEYYEPSGGDDRQSLINPDWSLTKTKTANLYSQVPQVQCTHENSQYADAIPPFAKALNYELSEKRANVGVPMEEVLNDMVNAAGIGAVLVGYMARFEPKQVPVEEVFQSIQGPMPTKDVPPEQLQQLADAGMIHLREVPQVVDYRFFCLRLSPGDLLWPRNFRGSNFDDADWTGHTGRGPWPVLKNEFKLRDEQHDEACGGAERTSDDDLRTTSDGDKDDTNDVVTYDEIYYWRYRVDPDEKSFTAIWRLVFVHGIKEPVVHEPWKGQQYDPQSRKYIGCQKPPIRFGTLTYVSDHAVPPSDSAAGRPQVNDMRRSRSQMFDNRDRSRPLRWFDVNRVDPLVQDHLMKGTWQGMIPTNGDGARTVGEVARASYPSEDLTFDKVTKADLMESWQIGPNQSGTTGTGITATESDNVQANFSTRIGQERNAVARLFLGACEVLAGWMVLYGDFPTLTDEEKQRMFKAWDNKRIVHNLVLKIRPDAQIVLDSQQRIKRLTEFLNIAGKSGAIDITPTIAEIAELTGLDPATTMKKPEPPPPQEPNISLRISGKEDMVNPLVMGLLISLGKAPSPENLKAAQMLLQAAAASPLPQPSGVLGPDGQPVPAPGSGVPAPSDGSEGPHPPPEDWALMPKVAKRSRDIAGG